MAEQLLYKSTRGESRSITSSEAIIKGIAEDGGLFVPQTIPLFDYDFCNITDMNYKEIAYMIMSKFFSDFTEEELKYCINNAYDKKFDAEDICPIKKVDDIYFLELFHGPTIAFKDMALSILPYLMQMAIKKQKIDKEIIILTATSGDTGKAALEGFSEVDGTKIMVFFPEEGVSKIQKSQMKTHKGSNTCVVGVNGNFDDAQNGVKNIFGDALYNKMLYKEGYMLSSANSINIGRLIPQIVYYFYSYILLLKQNQIKNGELVNFVVPTGNFGNILAGYYAKKMGLPINKLICASNENNVIYDFIKMGTYDKNREFINTISPSMDILISSNLERLLFQIVNEDSSIINDLMNKLKSEGKYSISSEMKEKLKDFYSGYTNDYETEKSIKNLFEESNYIMDTHTAVAYNVYEIYKKETNDNTKTIIVSTASPYKFTKSVMMAIDSAYKNKDDFELIMDLNKISKIAIPKAIDNIDKREIVHKAVCDKNNMKNEINNFLKINM